MVGIIPLDGYGNDEQFPYAPWLKPIVKDLTLVENAVMQCAFFGCKQIFIVCEERSAKMLKRHVGEWVEDPSHYWRHHLRPTEYRVQIPIYYVRMTEKDKRQRGSYTWAILQGAEIANRTARHVSRWTMPEKFFVTFPWAAFDFWEIKKFRPAFVAVSEFYFSHNGKTAWDGEFLPFTFTQSSWREMRKNFFKENTLVWRSISDFKRGEKWLERLPLEEQHSGRTFPLDKLLLPIDNSTYKEAELEQYYNAYTWDGYRDAVSKLKYQRPKTPILKTANQTRELERLGEYYDEQR
tara:strand:+ start:2655 stop:3536 length:882 start_codon:yes stop_codon:yes gene_type:complete